MQPNEGYTNAPPPPYVPPPSSGPTGGTPQTWLTQGPPQPIASPQPGPPIANPTPYHQVRRPSLQPIVPMQNWNPSPTPLATAPSYARAAAAGAISGGMLGQAYTPTLGPQVPAVPTYGATPMMPAFYYPFSWGRGGGGRGGGGYAASSYGTPGYYRTAFEGIFGSPEGYYDENRGGLDQAYRDYQELNNLWMSRTGRTMTAEESANLLNSFASIASQMRVMGRQPTMGDLFNYVQRILAPAPEPPRVSYLRMGEF